MCAINPRFKKRFVLDVYTSDMNITAAEFNDKVISRALQAEQQLNQQADLRWHVKDSTEEAD